MPANPRLEKQGVQSAKGIPYLPPLTDTKLAEAVSWNHPQREAGVNHDD